MPRRARKAPVGMVFHCLNRGNDRRAIFDDAGNYAAFEGAMESVVRAIPMRVLAYCLMPNHWHLLLWPRADGQLAAFMQRLQVTHVRRWHQRRATAPAAGTCTKARSRASPCRRTGISWPSPGGGTGVNS